MIDILHNYWRAFLWTDDQGYSGVAVTLFLLIASTMGGAAGGSTCHRA